MKCINKQEQSLDKGQFHRHRNLKLCCISVPGREAGFQLFVLLKYVVFEGGFNMCVGIAGTHIPRIAIQH